MSDPHPASIFVWLMIAALIFWAAVLAIWFF
jgi:hypothetical protein